MQMDVTELSDAIQLYGEVHMVVDGYDSELEARRGQTSFNADNTVMSIQGPSHTLHVSTDNIVSWYKPREVVHE